VRLKVGAVEGGAGEARGAKQYSVSFQLAQRIAANWKQMLMISVECPPATLGVVLRAGANWKHAHHWAASPPLARQPHPLLITPGQTSLQFFLYLFTAKKRTDFYSLIFTTKRQ